MAGSWGHITNEDGVYTGAELLENGGDVEEFAKQAYGMVWYLAGTLALRTPFTAEGWIADARRNWRSGIAASPTSLFEEG